MARQIVASIIVSDSHFGAQRHQDKYTETYPCNIDRNLSVDQTFCLYQSLYLYIYPSSNLFVYHSIYQPIYHQSICLQLVYLSCLLLRMCVCMDVYMHTRLYVHNEYVWLFELVYITSKICFLSYINIMYIEYLTFYCKSTKNI